MLHKIHKKDIPKASAVLADAFQHDPLWNKFFEGESHFDLKFRACFETPIRFCYTFGEVYATSKNLEGIAAWVPGNLSYMTMWGMIRSGAIFPGIRMGAKAGKKMRPVFGPLEHDRKENMRGKSFIYRFLYRSPSKIYIWFSHHFPHGMINNWQHNLFYCAESVLFVKFDIVFYLCFKVDAVSRCITVISQCTQ